MWEGFWGLVKIVCIIAILVVAWPLCLAAAFVWCLFKLIESFTE